MEIKYTFWLQGFYHHDGSLISGISNYKIVVKLTKNYWISIGYMTANCWPLTATCLLTKGFCVCAKNVMYSVVLDISGQLILPYNRCNVAYELVEAVRQGNLGQAFCNKQSECWHLTVDCRIRNFIDLSIYSVLFFVIKTIERN